MARFALNIHYSIYLAKLHTHTYDMGGTKGVERKRAVARGLDQAQLQKSANTNLSKHPRRFTGELSPRSPPRIPQAVHAA